MITVFHHIITDLERWKNSSGRVFPEPSQNGDMSAADSKVLMLLLSTPIE